MTLDPSKNTLIDYNELNLPSRVDFDMDKSINYTYDALGNKLQKRVVNTGAAESTVDYSGAFVYETNMNFHSSNLQVRRMKIHREFHRMQMK